jgi:ABC-type lipoprotein release transport system permease subunit
VTVALYRFRSELRRRWRSYLAMVLLTGVGAGAVLGALAGARRTASGFDRVQRVTRGSDVFLNPNDDMDLSKWSVVNTLPEVEDSGNVVGIAVARLDADGRPKIRWFLDYLTLASETPNVGHTFERPSLLAGRAPNVDRADEVLVNRELAQREHLDVGDHFKANVYDAQELFNALPAGREPRGQAITLTVTGIALPLDDATRAGDDPLLSPQVQETPAFLRRFHVTPLYFGTAMRLRDGVAGLPALRKSISRALPGVDVNYEGRDVTRTRLDHAVRPYVFALVLFALLAAVAVTAIVGQTLTRHVRLAGADADLLRALGCGRRTLTLVGVLRGLTIGVGGALIALVVAWAASPVFPLGPLHEIDPSNGFDLDATVLAIGAVLVVAIVVLHGAILSRNTRRAMARRSRVGDALAELGASAQVANGARFAFTARSGAGVAPVRSTLFGLGVALAALSGTIVYAAALHQFVSTPAQYGWMWDYQANAFDEEHNPDGAALAKMPEVTGAMPTLYAQLVVDGHAIGAIGVKPTRGVSSGNVLAGRAPRAADEIALGGQTMRDLGVHIGDHIDVSVGDQHARLHVVGKVVLARFAPYPQSEQTGLGIGALMHFDGVKQLYGGGVGAQGLFYLVNVADSTKTSRADLQKSLYGDDPFGGKVYGAQRPNDVLSYDRLQRTPLALAALLILLGAGTLVHLLVTAVRERRRDLAVLRCVGSTSRQVRSTVLVQAFTVALVAVLLGLPVGVLGGRWLWDWTASWLGVPAAPRIPALALTAVGVITIAATLLVALAPARRATRLQPAEILRSE